MGRRRKADNARRENLLRARNSLNEPHAALTPHHVGPGDVTEDSIEQDPDDGDEPENITDEIQLDKFIQVLRTAQQLGQRPGSLLSARGSNASQVQPSVVAAAFCSISQTLSLRSERQNVHRSSRRLNYFFVVSRQIPHFTSRK